jgi:CheY-like chemotaxis protein
LKQKKWFIFLWHNSLKSIKGPDLTKIIIPMISRAHQSMSSLSTGTYHVLLIEDEPAEIYLVQDAIDSGDLTASITLHVAIDGCQARDFLRNASPEAITPDLILLDLHLPYINGYDLLEEIKGDYTLKNIPVIVLTASVSDEAIAQTYRLHANGYLSKPVGCEELNEVIALFRNHWAPQKLRGDR